MGALLDRHHLDGRLDGAELAGRLAQVSAAVTRADLNRTVADLPGAADTVPVRDVLELVGTGGDQRRWGEWLVPPRIVLRSWFGNAHLDMRRARFVTGEVTIESDIVIGNLDVRLPAGATADLAEARTGFGSVRDRLGASERRGVPHVVVLGGVRCGNITVR
ncbi:DUF1707 SHOCT-like domain-containing protein [Pseudonocardia sp. HH130630-07]|uniref:DUF1707 SHOCT-like domain-containing protein n=1 Tax=Pseudonocardia sp. HH130630-07 TaxID=1690815 RepID=UPI000814BFEF|nr:DUF1707 domain-containing protein [Pseudonocardia sp. HH130630-07]ANY09363.1 hypothetical protein AFB00_27485 [Pseudonocardia sp. HH130630-07]